MIKFLCMLMIIIATLCNGNECCNTNKYTCGKEVEVYETDDLSTEILETRQGKGKLIIERCVGIVTDAEKGDGKILNTTSEYDYISYRGVKGNLHKGDIVITYFVYNPDNNYVDDMERYDLPQGK